MEVGYNPRFRPDMDRLVKGLKVILGETTVLSSASGSKKSEANSPSVQPGSRYDLRGAQFAGGFAETVKGDQVGGVINNSPAQMPVSVPQTPAPFTEKLGNGVTLDMVHIQKGDFMMGSPENEAGRYSDEVPQHRVHVPAFYMGKYPVNPGPMAGSYPVAEGGKRSGVWSL